MLTRNFQAFVLNFTLGTLAKIFPELFAESFEKFLEDFPARFFQVFIQRIVLKNFFCYSE